MSEFRLIYKQYGSQYVVPYDTLGEAVMTAWREGENYYPIGIKHDGEYILHEKDGTATDWLKLYHERLASEYNEDAYDGSTGFQKRELTARERDILCRVLGDIFTHCATMVGPAPEEGKVTYEIDTSKLDAVRIRFGEANFIEIIAQLRDVLTPRRD